MQFKVPQDVQRADTIIGPLTWRQLFILGGGGGLCYGIYVTLAKTYFIEVWLPPVAIIGALTASLAFIKIHGLTFEKFLMALIEFHFLPKKRIWKKGQAEPFVSFIQRKAEEPKKPEPIQEKKPQKSIKELAQILDQGGGESFLDQKEITDPDVLDAINAKQEKKKELEKIINHQN